MKIHYVTGSRADFGLMLRNLKTLNDADQHQLGIVVTGQHTLEKYGQTTEEISKCGIEIVGEIPVQLTGVAGEEMAIALSEELAGITRLWSKNRPELVLLLGDRGEMLAAALAAVHLGIHVAHIHGGERSGTLDESFRHAISKLAHIHFPATEESADRLVKMGENREHITVIGAPGLVGIRDGIAADRVKIQRQYGFSDTAGIALTVFHPVVQEAELSSQQIRCVTSAVSQMGYAQIILRPNSDAGGADIDAYLDTLNAEENTVVLTHLLRDDYLHVLASVDMLIGNSSSGIVESASLDTPCVNIGSRQNNRQRNTNTIDCPDLNIVAVQQAMHRASQLPGHYTNVYGDGSSDKKMLQALNIQELSPKLLEKLNAY
jgi:UDP-hydrolysing UDP-N-acetyl-D-glucosamine 2-epimerase